MSGKAVLTAEPITMSVKNQEGRIPLQFRIGVTGHRQIAGDDPNVSPVVRQVLELIDAHRRSGTRSTPVSVAVISALAEGADRIVAREALSRGATLEVVLPLDEGEYLKDFITTSSRSEFSALISEAASITRIPSSDDRAEAYERAGRAIVHRADVLVALWDGQPAQGRGGTADIVDYARRQNVPVVWVPVERAGGALRIPVNEIAAPTVPERLGPLSDEAFEMLDRFNSIRIRTFGTAPHSELLPANFREDVPMRVQRFVDRVQPCFDRAELVARRSQRWFLHLTKLLFSLAAAAVIVVATQIIFVNRQPKIVWGEVLALGGVIAALLLGRRARWHDRWISTRYLVERIRCSVFLVATGAPDVLQPEIGRVQPARAEQADPDREWAERAYREVCGQQTVEKIRESEVPMLRALLIKGWVDDQLNYHDAKSRKYAKQQRRLTWSALTLFSVSALVALLHSTSVLESSSGPDVLGYLSIIIPAIGAALSGYGAQREYSRLAERSRQMVIRLEEVRALLAEGQDLSSLRKATWSTEILMRSENAEWYDIVRLHDLEVPA